jgi:hypothetical protein
VRQYFAPVADGRQWFALHLGAYLDFYVGDAGHPPFRAGDYRAAWVTQTYEPNSLVAGQPAPAVSVTYRNRGPAVLFAGGAHPVHLRGIRPADRESGFVDPESPLAIGSHRDQGVRMDQDRVEPGELFSFSLPVRAAAGLHSGTYPEYFRPVAEGLTWFGPADVFWPFTVQ